MRPRRRSQRRRLVEVVDGHRVADAEIGVHDLVGVRAVTGAAARRGCHCRRCDHLPPRRPRPPRRRRRPPVLAAVAASSSPESAGAGLVSPIFGFTGAAASVEPGVGLRLGADVLARQAPVGASASLQSPGSSRRRRHPACRVAGDVGVAGAPERLPAVPPATRSAAAPPRERGPAVLAPGLRPAQTRARQAIRTGGRRAAAGSSRRALPVRCVGRLTSFVIDESFADAVRVVGRDGARSAASGSCRAPSRSIHWWVRMTRSSPSPRLLRSGSTRPPSRSAAACRVAWSRLRLVHRPVGVALRAGGGRGGGPRRPAGPCGSSRPSSVEDASACSTASASCVPRSPVEARARTRRR